MDPPATARGASAADNHTAGTPDASQDQKRRSSSRSIKRKRFDDEIVEYSLGLPPAQVHRLGARSRTQSQTIVPPATAASAVATAITPTSTTSAGTETSLLTAAAATSIAVASSSATGAPHPVQSPSSASTSVVANASPITTTSTTPSSVPATQPKGSATTITSSAAAAGAVTTSNAVTGSSATLNSTTVAATTNGVPPMSHKSHLAGIPAVNNTTTTSTAPATATEKRSRVPKSANNSAHALAGGVLLNNAALHNNVGAPASKKAKKSRVGQQISTKDLGRWKPIDDLALILGVQQTNDLRMVHRGIKFSCKFTVQELQSRWYSLMYEETISRLAVAAMRNLHPELVEAVQAKALYTTQEEELLGGIKSSESPTLDTFQELLDKNALVFYSARTAKALHTHWQLMKQYALLPDQQSQLVATSSSSPSLAGVGIGGVGSSSSAASSFAADGTSTSKLLTFAEAEEQLNDGELLGEPRDDTVELELTLADRCNKKEIRMLENELTRWTVLVDSLTGIGFMPEFDNQTLAVLRGRLVRYLMRSREISFGRTTKDQAVDVDLSLEGPAHKASRRQGTIKLRSNGDFFIVNEGKRPLFIDGAPLLQGNKGRLSNNTIIEMAGLRFIFLINSDLINAIRQESAKMSGPLS